MPRSSSDLFSAITEDEALARVLGNLAERIRLGEAINVDQAVREHPDHADDLRRLFPLVRTLGADEYQASNSAGRGQSHDPLQADSRERPAGDPFPTGQPIGDYQIVREIGRGGMGIVYEARQLSLNRRVAVKVLPLAAALDPRALARFRQESLAAAQLDHPHIVHVHNVGCDRGVHYYAMQYIEGQSLADVIAEMKQIAAPFSREAQPSARASERSNGGASSEAALGCASRLNGSGDETQALAKAAFSTDRGTNPKEFYRGVARLAIRAAEALDYAHEHGIVHRDIKPGNLLLDAAGKLYITDFGLARLETDSHLTQTGDLMGTLRYMSPEQAQGEHGLVDPRSDIYGLGATLYELLTLAPLYAGQNRAELLKRIAGEDPPPLRRRDAAIPEELEIIISKCLEKTPADRYLTARNLADDLQRFLDQKPLSAKRATLTERLWKWSRRHQQAVLVAAAGTSLLTIVLAVSAVLIVREQANTAIERQQTEIERAATRQHQAINRQHHYDATFNLAGAAWQRGDLAHARQHLEECRPALGEVDLRGFEWYWLSRAVDSLPPVWRRHSCPVYSARFSHHGKWLATCGQDGARIWSWPGGELLAHLATHRWDINTVSFSPDDSMLASASDDGTVKIWETTGWTELRTLVHEGRLNGAEFSPDGATLACAELHVGPLSSDGKAIELVRLWDVQSWQESGRLIGSPGDLHGIAWSPDGEFLATAGPRLRIWNFGTRAVHFEFDVLSQFKSVAFSPVASRKFLAAGQDGRTFIFDVDGPPREITQVQHGAETVMFDPRNQNLLLTADRSRYASIERSTKLAAWVESAGFRDTDSCWSATFAPDKSTIVTTNEQGAIRLWDRHRLADRIIVRDRTVPLAFSPDSSSLFYNDDGLHQVDLSTGGVVRSLSRPGEAFRAVTLSPDGEWLAAGDREGKVDVWETANWRRRNLVTRDGDPVDSFAFIPGQAPALVVAGLKRSFIAGLPSGASQPIARQVLEQASRVIFSPDGRFAAVHLRNTDRLMQVWDLKSPEKAPVIEDYYSDAAFSADSSQFAACCRDDVIRLWQVDDWANPLLLMGGGSPLAISPDGRTVAARAGNAIRLWSAVTGRELITFDLHIHQPQGLQFSRDGTALVVGGAEGINFSNPQIVVWLAGKRK